MCRGFAFTALAASVALMGCGSASRPRPATARVLFAEDCSACHSLIGNESLRRQGGDLLDYRFSRRDLLEFAREMPVRRPLSPAQLEAIVVYVSAKERSAGGHQLADGRLCRFGGAPARDEDRVADREHSGVGECSR
jgi:mono/diheme cytochrome c family protein